MRQLRATLPESAPPKPKTIEDAAAYASWLTNAIVSGKIDRETGKVVAIALKEFRGASEKAELERQVKKYKTVLQAVLGCPTCGPKAAPLLVASRD